MPIKSPLGQFSRVSSRSTAEARRPIIPEVIRLPDGREFLVRDLMMKTPRPTLYNLRSRQPHVPRNRPSMVKYTLEDRIGMADAEVADIQRQWQVSENYARILKNQGQRLKLQFGHKTR